MTTCGRPRRGCYSLHPDLQVVNSQRDRGSLEFTAGRLHVTVKQGDGGFISEAALDVEGDGFEEDDVIAVWAAGTRRLRGPAR